MRRLMAACSLLLLAITPAVAQKATPGPSQGGSLPLAGVLDVAKAYPNLITQVRLRLIATGKTKDQITCSAQRFPAAWTGLSGARLAPYVCLIGRRTLTITAEPIYYDKAGYKLKPADPALAAKATKVAEGRLKWSWK